MDLFDSGEFIGPCTAVDMVARVGGTAKDVAAALTDLDFTIVRRESKRRVRTGKGKKTKVEKVPRIETSKLAGLNQSLRSELNQAQHALNAANNQIQGHLATINRLDRENVILQLNAGETPSEPAEPAAIAL